MDSRFDLNNDHHDNDNHARDGLNPSYRGNSDFPQIDWDSLNLEALCPEFLQSPESPQSLERELEREKKLAKRKEENKMYAELSRQRAKKQEQELKSKMARLSEENLTLSKQLNIEPLQYTPLPRLKFIRVKADEQMSPDDKKKLRKENNRKGAKVCRQNKKNELDNIEKFIRKLFATNQKLSKQIKGQEALESSIYQLGNTFFPTATKKNTLVLDETNNLHLQTMLKK